MITQGSKVLAKYVALYAAHLIKSNATMAALQLFTKYGAPVNPQVLLSPTHFIFDAFSLTELQHIQEVMCGDICSPVGWG